MTQTATSIGPADHGRRMSLEEFEAAEAIDGRRYELSRGQITVTNIPNRRHHAMVNAARKQISLYEASNPAAIVSMAGGSDCKILLVDLDSERHPDWAVYTTPMPEGLPTEADLWAAWVPALVIEVVSPDSALRDYVEKPEEYLRFGVPEYLVIDEDRQEMLARRRAGGRYVTRIVRPGEAYHSFGLPGLAIDLAAIFDAARAVGG